MKSAATLLPLLLLTPSLAPAQALFHYHDTLCLGSNPNIESIVNDAASYAWDFGDGKTSTAKNPSHSYASTGNFDLQLCITALPTQVFVDTVEVLAHEPANFFESLVEGRPDAYFILKNSSGTEVYRSQVRYNVSTPFKIPCSVLLSDQTYLLELWDFDALDTDDDLGKVFMANPTAGGTFSFGGLTIRFVTTPAQASYCFEKPVAVVLPWITYNAATDVLTAHPGGDAVNHKWFRDGVEIPNAVGQTLAGQGPGVFTVQLFSAFCNAISPPFSTVGAGEPQAGAAAFRIFPNPSDGQFRIDFFEKNAAPGAEIRVFDLLGRLVFSKKIAPGAEAFVDLGGLPEGVFRVQVAGLGARTVVVRR